MNALTTVQQDAIFHAKLAMQYVDQSLVSAAKCGDALTKIKAGLPHGDYLPWIEANMPVNERQCRKFVQLAKDRPQLLIANRHSNADLDINSELMLLAFSADDQAKIRDFALEENLTRKQIQELTEQLKVAHEETTAEIKRLKLANESLKTMKAYWRITDLTERFQYSKRTIYRWTALPENPLPKPRIEQRGVSCLWSVEEVLAWEDSMCAQVD